MRSPLHADLVLDFDRRTDLHAGQAVDQKLAASVAFSRAVPGGIHHIDFVLRNFLPLAGIRDDGRTDDSGRLSGRIKRDLYLRLTDFSGITQNPLHIMHPKDGRMGILYREFLAVIHNRGVGCDPGLRLQADRRDRCGWRRPDCRDHRSLPFVVSEVLQGPLEFEVLLR